MPFFTASGERAWVPGWDPVGDDQCWVTNEGEKATYWLTVDRSATSARYARVTPGDTAGTVLVDCRGSNGGAEVRVTYDLHALGPEGEARLERFVAGYDEMLAEWQRRTSDLL